MLGLKLAVGFVTLCPATFSLEWAFSEMFIAVGLACFGIMMTLRKPEAEVLDLIPKCFWRLPPPNWSEASTIATPLGLKTSSLTRLVSAVALTPFARAGY